MYACQKHNGPFLAYVTIKYVHIAFFSNLHVTCDTLIEKGAKPIRAHYMHDIQNLYTKVFSTLIHL